MQYVLYYQNEHTIPKIMHSSLFCKMFSVVCDGHQVESAETEASPPQLKR